MYNLLSRAKHSSYNNALLSLAYSWIKTLEDGVKGAKELLHRQEVAKVASVTPEKIRLFDEKV